MKVIMFPRCKQCYSTKDFNCELLDEEKNKWRVSCLDCGWVKISFLPKTEWEMRDGKTFVDGLPAALRTNAKEYVWIQKEPKEAGSYRPGVLIPML